MVTGAAARLSQWMDSGVEFPTAVQWHERDTLDARTPRVTPWECAGGIRPHRLARS